MQTNELIEELKLKVANGEIGQEELMARLGLSQTITLPATASPSEDSSHFSVTKMLYILGAAIVVVGIVIFVGQMWDDMGALAHVIVTLGLGLLFAGLGSVLLNQQPQTNLGTVFHFLGGMLIPGGSLVLLDEAGASLDEPWVVAMTFFSIFVFYVILNRMHKNAVLTFFAILNATTTCYLVLYAVVDSSSLFAGNLYLYLTMMLGVSYLLLAESFKDGWNNRLIGALNFFGITGFLGAGFSRVLDSGFWEVLYFLVLFGCLFLSVYLKSRIILIMSTVFLIIHVSYITGEHFADSIGWPLSLVFLGFVFIGLGYTSISLNNKYIKST
ncbi:hypothetical protein KC845_04190 [Candidatus Kaiserbacteria bacterium]|nr:hypothetical protein [Candidatus Kaiserbacteria bacterium]